MLRHTSLTELRKAGWKPEHLQKQAGHKNFQTTLSVYYHPTDEDIPKDATKSKKDIKII
ncbi:MAG TPA: tyrosine-type recombinase/integrase [Patescibacteria group bacterium]|nr:tyrosine-type recombinase/integrase [Patescibacteria group bacterium]